MQLGFVSAILPDQTLDEVLDFAAAAGFDCVELMCWPTGKAERRYAGVTHVDVANLDDAATARIRGRLAANGVGISGLGYYPNVLSPDEAEAEACRTHLLRVIDAAARLGVEVVNTFIGRDWTRSVEDNWPRFEAVWPGIVAHAEARGVRIGIENCPMLFTADEWPGGKNLAVSPAIWRRMFAAIPSPSFGLNFDPSHLVWQRLDLVKAIQEFAPRFVHVHAKDARVDLDRLGEVGILAHPNLYHTPKLPGLGDVNWPTFFSYLTDAGYDGAVCVEVEDRAYEGGIALRQAALRQSLRFLRQLA